MKLFSRLCVTGVYLHAYPVEPPVEQVLKICSGSEDSGA